jgi:hypothetical protein
MCAPRGLWEFYHVISLLCKIGYKILHRYNKHKVTYVFNKLKITPWRRKLEWRYSSTILAFFIRWRYVVSFTLRLLYTWKKKPMYLMHKMLIGRQNRSGKCGEETDFTATRKRTRTSRVHFFSIRGMNLVPITIQIRNRKLKLLPQILSCGQFLVWFQV